MAALDAMTIRLHLRAIRVLAVVEDLPESLVVAVVAISSVIRCSACGHKTARVHATRKVKVRDLPVPGRPLTLVWHRRRFRCKSCRTTTTETHPFFANGMTTRLARAVVADARDMTIAAVARRHRLSWHRVMKLVLAEAELLARAGAVGRAGCCWSTRSRCARAGASSPPSSPTGTGAGSSPC